ncbi:MAG: Modification methylase DpnIIA [Bacteroidota bacterium]|jgi:DNA adenine methylase
MKFTRTPIVYYGGKQLMVKDILPLIPQHKLYCEPFAGGAAIYFVKPPAEIEVINDLNHFIVNFYEQCQTNFLPLQEMIQATLHNRQAHVDAKVMYDNPHLFTPLQCAWAFWVLTAQGYSGMISNTWSYAVADGKKERSLNNKRLNFTDVYQQRLAHTQIECAPALKVIKSRDRVDSFFYIDPPYYNADMAHYGGYTARDFEDLL